MILPEQLIIPEKIEPITLGHYSPSDVYLGDFTDLENLYFRIRIAQGQLEGYYVLDQEGNRFDIESNGKMSGYPVGYDQYMDGLSQLFKFRKDDRTAKQ